MGRTFGLTIQCAGPPHRFARGPPPRGESHAIQRRRLAVGAASAITAPTDLASSKASVVHVSEARRIRSTILPSTGRAASRSWALAASDSSKVAAIGISRCAASTARLNR